MAAVLILLVINIYGALFAPQFVLAQNSRPSFAGQTGGIVHGKPIPSGEPWPAKPEDYPQFSVTSAQPGVTSQRPGVTSQRPGVTSQRPDLDNRNKEKTTTPKTVVPTVVTSSTSTPVPFTNRPVSVQTTVSDRNTFIPEGYVPVDTASKRPVPMRPSFSGITGGMATPQKIPPGKPLPVRPEDSTSASPAIVDRNKETTISTTEQNNFVPEKPSNRPFLAIYFVLGGLKSTNKSSSFVNIDQLVNQNDLQPVQVQSDVTDNKPTFSVSLNLEDLEAATENSKASKKDVIAVLDKFQGQSIVFPVRQEDVSSVTKDSGDNTNSKNPFLGIFINLEDLRRARSSLDRRSERSVKRNPATMVKYSNFGQVFHDQSAAANTRFSRVLLPSMIPNRPYIQRKPEKTDNLGNPADSFVSSLLPYEAEKVLSEEVGQGSQRKQVNVKPAIPTWGGVGNNLWPPYYPPDDLHYGNWNSNYPQLYYK